MHGLYDEPFSELNELQKESQIDRDLVMNFFRDERENELSQDDRYEIIFTCLSFSENLTLEFQKLLEKNKE